jgi:hypothetical protein
MKTLAKAIAVLSPTCKEASRLQSKALDGKLSLMQRIGLQIHLCLCKWCRRYGKQIGFLHDAAREHPDEFSQPLSRTLSQDARERMKQRLRKEEEKPQV